MQGSRTRGRKRGKWLGGTMWTSRHLSAVLGPIINSVAWYLGPLALFESKRNMYQIFWMPAESLEQKRRQHSPALYSQ